MSSHKMVWSSGNDIIRWGFFFKAHSECWREDSLKEVEILLKRFP